MSRDHGLVYPLWTDPHGPAPRLDRATGEVGLDHLTIPVVTGKLQHFRLEPAQPPHWFASEGGWHFPPDPPCYGRGPIRPRPARWFGKRNLLARIRDYAAQRDIALILRLDLRAVGALLEHEPHLRPRNAWGDEVLAAGACVLNPELRELLHATLQDLLRYEPAGFQLVDWAPDLPVDREPQRPLGWQPLAQELSDICFCPACRQVSSVAGTDPDQAARSVCVHVQRLLTQPGDQKTPVSVRHDGLLNAYQQARRRDTASWLQHLADTHQARRRYLLFTETTASDSIVPLLGEDAFQPLLRTCGPLLAPDGASLQARIRSSTRLHALTLPVWRPAIQQADHLVRLVSAATNAGITFLDFEDLDQAPEEAVVWLKQAVRFARRG